jgi:hypothetical protein
LYLWGALSDEVEVEVEVEGPVSGIALLLLFTEVLMFFSQSFQLNAGLFQ